MLSCVNPIKWSSRPQDLLHELSAAHEAVLAAMATMSQVTDQESDTLAYTKARYRISSAGLRRRQIFQRICAHLTERVSDEDTDALRKVQEVDRELSSASAAHISRWIPSEVEGDWSGYCAASRQIREQMKRELEAERRLLFPILERLSLRQGVGAARGA